VGTIEQLQAKIDAITPKMKFLHCMAALGKFASMYPGSIPDQVLGVVNFMHDGQKEVAKRWEAKEFAHSIDFLNSLVQDEEEVKYWKAKGVKYDL